MLIAILFTMLIQNERTRLVSTIRQEKKVDQAGALHKRLVVELTSIRTANKESGKKEAMFNENGNKLSATKRLVQTGGKYHLQI